MPKAKLKIKPRVMVHFIQDRSGSMQSVWTEAVTGFNAFIEELKLNKKVDYRFSLTVFDDEILTPVSNSLITDPFLIGTLANNPPRGWTALYDALGAAIQDTAIKASDASKVIFVIATDGQENASRTWTKSAIHSLIDSQLSIGNRTFTYMGTQPETWADAAAIGFNLGSTVMYKSGNIGAAYSVMASSLNNFSNDHKISATRSMTSTYAPEAILHSSGMTVKTDDDE